MRGLVEAVARLVVREEGPTAVEYAMVFLLAFLAVLSALNVFTQFAAAA